jgi:hypothetical protein
MTNFYFFGPKTRFYKIAFLGVALKIVIRFFCPEFTLNVVENNIFLDSLIWVIDWCANYFSTKRRKFSQNLS